MPKKPRPEHGFLIIDSTWDEFKAIVVAKALKPQYVDDGRVYYVFALDGAILYRTELPAKGFEPGNASDAGKVDIEKARDDFDDNFKGTANQAISAAKV